MRCDYCQQVFDHPWLDGPNGLYACQLECKQALEHHAAAELEPGPSLVATLRIALNVETGNPPGERCALATRIAPYVATYLRAELKPSEALLSDPVFLHAFDTLVCLTRLVDELERKLARPHELSIHMVLEDARDQIKKVIS